MEEFMKKLSTKVIAVFLCCIMVFSAFAEELPDKKSDKADKQEEKSTPKKKPKLETMDDNADIPF